MASHHTPALGPFPIEPSRNATDWAISLTPHRPPATPEDAIARQACAAVEREDGFNASAQHRLNGAYDGDEQHRAALKAIEMWKARA